MGALVYNVYLLQLNKTKKQSNYQLKKIAKRPKTAVIKKQIQSW
jgi:hypothetical protein